MFSIKQLLGAVVLLIVIGIAGFAYRSGLEHPQQMACTMDAKICPDGTAVGRGGPACEFSPCLPPNAEDKTIGLAFAIPEGYVSNADAIGMDETLRVVLDKQAVGGIPHSIIIRAYPIEEGKTAEETMIARTMFETSGEQATSMDQFTLRTIGGRTFYRVGVERFEAIIHTLYYLPRATDVLVFEVLERDVMSWMEPTLDIETLPEHAALITLLGTVQTQ